MTFKVSIGIVVDSVDFIKCFWSKGSDIMCEAQVVSYLLIIIRFNTFWVDFEFAVEFVVYSVGFAIIFHPGKVLKIKSSWSRRSGIS
jgi:hypothetical protein